MEYASPKPTDVIRPNVVGQRFGRPAREQAGNHSMMLSLIERIDANGLLAAEAPAKR